MTRPGPRVWRIVCGVVALTCALILTLTATEPALHFVGLVLVVFITIDLIADVRSAV